MTSAVLLQDLDEDNLDASFEQYCQDIQDTAAWGGQTELNALANVLQHHIKVYTAGLPVVDMGQQYKGVRPSWTPQELACCLMWSLRWHICACRCVLYCVFGECTLQAVRPLLHQANGGSQRRLRIIGI